MAGPPIDVRAVAAAIFREVTARIDGAALVREALAARPAIAAATHVLAIGKAALPMLAGLPALGSPGGAPAPRVLAVTTEAGVSAARALPANVEVHIGDHPLPSARSVAAAAAARAFVAACGAGGRTGDRLLVLLSGGASSLLCAPAPGLSLADKRAAVAAVARAGAPIFALNAVRKHLSSVKGGRLALETAAPIEVLALSDVVGDDPATVASGPFSPDPTTFAQALEIAEAAAGDALPAAARALLAAGARGEAAETPKPHDARLAQVSFQVLAGPARVAAEARAAAERRGLRAGLLWRDTELDVDTLAGALLERAAHEAGAGGAARVLIGNGEPVIRVPEGAGAGGRATHLALAVARGLRDLPEAAAGRVASVAFLAAGTDDRDGSSAVSGAVVDGGTWGRAAAAGADPEAALSAFASAAALGAAGDTLTGLGTSNLLDLHLLVVA